MSRKNFELPFCNPEHSHASRRSELGVKLVENTPCRKDAHGTGLGSSIGGLLSIVSNDLSCQHGKDII